jgi:predicted CopG family antitoxin
MTLKTIKISEENYRWLCSKAGEIQKELGNQVSIDRAISSLRKKRSLSDLAGLSTMTDKEAEDLNKEIRKGWKKWEQKFV